MNSDVVRRRNAVPSFFIAASDTAVKFKGIISRIQTEKNVVEIQIHLIADRCVNDRRQNQSFLFIRFVHNCFLILDYFLTVSTLIVPAFPTPRMLCIGVVFL